MKFKKWLNLIESSTKKLHRIPFSKVEFNTIDKYYFNLSNSNNMSNILNIEELEIGEKIADTVRSIVPYWSVSDIDSNKNIVYLNPIPPNPFVPNAEGEVVGAGGKIFDDTDFDVMSGKYETEKIDKLLDVINNKEYKDIRDIAYILLGTVAVQAGPNGSQGGWYAAGSGNNRGFQKGLNEKDIMQKDAKTIKEKLHMEVPESAINGTLNVGEWNQFVGGATDYNNAIKTKLEKEDFENPETMAKIILNSKQPQIRLRNAEILTKKAWQTDDSNYDQIIHSTALELAKQNMVVNNLDYLWKIKELFINLAGRKKWLDVLHAYHDSHDTVNRRYVARYFGDNKDINMLIKMLDKETKKESFLAIINKLYDIIIEEFSEQNTYGSFEYEFNKFIEKNPKEKEKIKNESKQIFEAIEKNLQKMKSTKNNDAEDNYYQKDLDLILIRIRFIEKIIGNK